MGQRHVARTGIHGPRTDHGGVVRNPIDLPDEWNVFTIALAAVNLLTIIAAVVVLWRGRGARDRTPMSDERSDSG
jgi:hypothetical protein